MDAPDPHADVAALIPQKELEGEIGDTHVALQARLMSQSMRKLTGAISRGPPRFEKFASNGQGASVA